MKCILLCYIIIYILSIHFVAGYGRRRRQAEEELAEEEPAPVVGQICDFGTGSLINSCSWNVPNGSHPLVRWRIAQGSQQFWLGGPGKDHTLLDTSGGYAYFETSYQQMNNRYVSTSINHNNHKHSNHSLSGNKNKHKNDEVIRPLISHFPLFQINKEYKKQIPVPDFSIFQSPNISDTGPTGLCMTFYYIIDGLSTESLQIILSDSTTRYNKTLMEYKDITDGEWRKSEILYTYAEEHTVTLI